MRNRKDWRLNKLKMKELKKVKMIDEFHIF